MTTELNLQKNSISQNKSNPKTKAAPKEVDYSKYQVGAHVFEPKGHLVNTPLWEAPVVAVQDTFENVKNLGKGLKGEGDDHRLGQLNNLGLQAGGLAIAGYLASTKVLPVKKGMEFVGFASFLASMTLFPVLFIQAPIKALYGFNVNQKYVDSYGRKKPFHTDPQYTPWDLYSSEKLNAIGDKMGIDKGIENRQAVIKEKMTKIATQSNTMWMMTAGIAVPTMCALLSSQAEKLLTHLNKTLTTSYLDKKMSKIGEIKEPNKKELKKFQAVLNENKDKPLNEKFVDDLAKMITGGEDTIIKDSFRDDLKELLKSNSVPSVAELFGDIKLELPSSKGIHTLVLKTTEIKTALEAKNLNQNVSLFGKKNEPQRNSVKNILSNLYKEQAKREIPEFSQERSIREALDTHFETIFNSKTESEPMVLNKSNCETLEKVYSSFNVFKQKSNIIQKYITHKVGQNESSVAATEWSKASDSILKALKFTDAEIKKAKESPSSARKVLETKFDEIAKDDNRYQETVKKVAEAVKNYEKEMDKSHIEGKNFIEVVKNTTKDIYGALSSDLAKIKDGGNPVFQKTANQVSNHFETSYQAEKERTKTYNNSKNDLEKEVRELNEKLNEKLKSEKTPKEEIEKLKEKITKMTPEYIEKTATEQAKEAVEGVLGKSKDAVFPGSRAYSIVYDAENKIIGGKSSLNKILHGLDLFKRIGSGEVEKALADKSDNYKKLFKEKIIGHMKYILIEGDIGTHMVKADIPEKEVYRDTMPLIYNVGQEQYFDRLLSNTKKEMTETAKNNKSAAPTEKEILEQVNKNNFIEKLVNLATEDAKEAAQKQAESGISASTSVEQKAAEPNKFAKNLITLIENKLAKEAQNEKEAAEKALNEGKPAPAKNIVPTPEQIKISAKKILRDFLPQSTDLHASTKKALGEASTGTFKEKLFTLFEQFGNGHYRFKPEYEFWQIKEETVLRKQSMVGESLNNFVQKAASKKYNTRAWFKMTGFAAAGIAAITLISPLFFGKVKQPHTVNKEVEANG